MTCRLTLFFYYTKIIQHVESVPYPHTLTVLMNMFITSSCLMLDLLTKQL
jgi:hypothetical protein